MRRAPRLSADWAEGFVAQTFGLSAGAGSLGGYEDQNFELSAEHRRYVLKLSAGDVPRLDLERQNRAMRHLGRHARRLRGVQVPVPMPAQDGAEVVDVTVDGARFRARLLSFVEGVPVRQVAYLSPDLLRELGAVAGTVATVLGSIADEAAPAGAWDLRDAGAMIADCVPAVEDARRRALAERTAASAETALATLRPALREGLIHADLTDENILVGRDELGRPRPRGVIDFGDLCRSWLVAELAVLATACLGRVPQVSALVELVRGFHATAPLREDEVDAIVPLIALRAVAAAVQTDTRAAADPANQHLATAVPWEWATLEAVCGLSPVARAAVRDACGFAPCAAAPAAQRFLAAHHVDDDGAVLVDGLGPETPVVDLSARTDELAFGGWLDRSAIAATIERRARDGLALGRYGESRIVDASGPEAEEPSTLHLGVDVFAAPGALVRAPLAGRVHRRDVRGLVLAHAPFFTHLRGIEPSLAEGADVQAGDPLGTIRAADDSALLPPHVHVQLSCEPIEALPGLAAPSLADAWLGVCPDPSRLLGVSAAAPVERPRLALEQRRKLVASPQVHYYAEPPEIVRGWRQWLYDSHARAYLDVVNNVAVLGHSHPRVAEAASRQLRMLNTNSRFLYGSMTRFAEALLEVMPDPLEVVFLVSSGSEANDLALQLVRHASGASDVLALQRAYHGWTAATSETSTHLEHNPDGRLGATIRAVPAPDGYRGYAGPDPGSHYAAHVRAAIAELQGQERGLAGFIGEAFSGVSGGLPLPDGYLQEVYAAVRGAGGLCIADEVQAGYGRLGAFFWAFEQQGVVPDVVSIAKCTGNGHPVAAVVTTRAIADRFGARAPWFSSVGGGPVSCEVGAAVLHALREERLQENARDVGTYLRAMLERLVERHPICGAVHGMGLYLGLELVRDPATLEPAVEEAAAVCERMLRLGVIVQPTGDFGSILKIKPPLVFAKDDADLLVERLDHVLATEWLRA